MDITYEVVYTASLGGTGPHPYWHYERGYWLNCNCSDCRQLRIDDPVETIKAVERQKANAQEMKSWT